MTRDPLDAYFASVRERPLVIEADAPVWAFALMSMAGGLLVNVPFLLVAANGWWALGLLVAALLLGAGTWVSVFSTWACDRRYEKARIAAIHARRRELGIKS